MIVTNPTSHLTYLTPGIRGYHGPHSPPDGLMSSYPLFHFENLEIANSLAIVSGLWPRLYKLLTSAYPF